MNVNFDWYKHNANYYDLFDADDIPYSSISESIGTILKKHKVKTIIDLGCGTGNFYIPFAKQGFKLFGVDISADMLVVAAKKIKAENLELNLLQSDIRRPLSGTFDAALCLYNVIGDLNYQSFSKVIKNMTNLVHKNGLICFDIMNFDNVKRFDFSNKYFIEKELQSNGSKILARNTKQKLNKVDHSLEIEQYVTINGETDDSSVSRCKMYLYTLKEVNDLLKVHNLYPLMVYGSYDKIKGITPFKKDDPLIGIIAQKK